MSTLADVAVLGGSELSITDFFSQAAASTATNNTIDKVISLLLEFGGMVKFR